MPFTINSVGTRYHGEKNLAQRSAPCPHCGHTVVLKSYDTRLYFVALFIPLIPLQRKRIIDYCPKCTRHYVMDQDKWETARQLNVSGAQDTFRSSPTPENGLALYQNYIDFHQPEEARTCQATLLQQFSDNARVHAYLGLALEKQGNFPEAARLLARAHSLRPDLPEARVGLARDRMRNKNLEEARKLLDFLEKPGAAQLYSLEPLETLANLFQAECRHTEALELYAKLMEGLPAIADHKLFRKKVAISEKALRSHRSILPKKKFSWKNLFPFTPSAASAGSGRSASPVFKAAVVALIALLVLITSLANNYYTKQHRTLTVLNGFGSAVTVKIQGRQNWIARPGLQSITLPEGRYHASISGPVREEIDFVIQSGFWDRWAYKPAWVLNLGGEELYSLTTAIYSLDPTPPSHAFQFGTTFSSFPDIDYLFEPLPEKLKLGSRNTSRTVNQLEVLHESPVSAFYYLVNQKQNDEALRLAEWALRQDPINLSLLNAYCSQALSLKSNKQLATFLRAGLGRRPVIIEWHRLHQELTQKFGVPRPRLLADYDEFLLSDPTNSALLYLRGRICPYPEEATQWFQRSLAADATNPYAHYALGFDLFTLGQWQEAKPLLDRALQLHPEEMAFLHYQNLNQFGLGHFKELEEDLRLRLKKKPRQFGLLHSLVKVLVAQGRAQEAGETIRALERGLEGQVLESSQESLRFLHYSVLYGAKDFAGLEREAKKASRSPQAQVALCQALLEEGRPAEAEPIIMAKDQENPEPLMLLALSLAWSRAGNRERALHFQHEAGKACDLMEEEDYHQAGQLLLRSEAPVPSKLGALHLLPAMKAAMAAILAQSHPETAAAFAGMARTFNVDPQFPYHLINQSIHPTP